MRFLSATQLFDGKQFLSANTVLVLDEKGCLKDSVSAETLDASQIERHDGIICPGFVNAHCHIELSYLYKHIQQKTGFTGFASELMAKRFTFPKEEIKESIRLAEQKMWENGIVAVGDICNSDDSFEIKDGSKIKFHSFIELIALNPALAQKVLTAGKELQGKVRNHTSTLIPHAPYSVSLELMQEMGRACAEGLPLTIHNQESKAENEFFERGTGKVLELYKNLNIDISYYQPSGKTSLQSYLKNLPADRNLILVHNTFSNEEDVKFGEAYSKNLYWCLCPNANLFIENALPDVNLFEKHNCKPVIGTDSLASNHQLSVLAELNTLWKHFGHLKDEDLLQWATYNGACALGMQSEFGGFITNKNAGLNLISLASRQFGFVKKLA